jgi:hypothetical protein
MVLLIFLLSVLGIWAISKIPPTTTGAHPTPHDRNSFFLSLHKFNVTIAF